MKKITLSLAFLLFLGLNAVFAQQKIAYANQDSVLFSMPEFKEQQKNLESYGKQLREALESKAKALEGKYAEFEKSAANWIPEVVEEKKKEIGRLQQEYQEFQQNSQLRLGQKQEELFNPLVLKLQKAINEIAKAEGYHLVLNNASLLYADSTIDITEKVIKKLGGGKK